MDWLTVAMLAAAGLDSLLWARKCREHAATQRLLLSAELSLADVTAERDRAQELAESVLASRQQILAERDGAVVETRLLRAVICAMNHAALGIDRDAFEAHMRSHGFTPEAIPNGIGNAIPARDGSLN